MKNILFYFKKIKSIYSIYHICKGNYLFKEEELILIWNQSKIIEYLTNFKNREFVICKNIWINQINLNFSKSKEL